MGDISIREYIRWPPASASEPTSTVVLTSPERRFVDVRIIPDGGGPGPSGSGSGRSSSSSSLDWAIAGTSSRSGPDGGRQSAVWNHWVDSRTTGPMRDEAEVEPRADGSEREWGRMLNPDTGLEAEYEEVWRSEELVAAAGGCVVLQTEEDGARGERGVVMRLGQYCQGILRVGEEITVERWVWSEGGGAWERVARFGEDQLPAQAHVLVDREDGWEVGGEVECSGRVWKVVEASG